MWDNNKFFNTYGSVIFKLANDLLFLLMAFFFVLIVADGILPGIISNYYDPAIVIILLLANILLIYFLEKKVSLNIKPKINKKTALFMLIIIALLVSNAFFHLNIWLNLFLTLLSLLVGYFIYKVFTEE